MKGMVTAGILLCISTAGSSLSALQYSAVNFGNDNIYLFNSDEYGRYDADDLSLDDSYPKSINSSTWPGLYKRDIDAALYLDDDTVIFYKNRTYTLYDIDSDRAYSGYPKRIVFSSDFLNRGGFDSAVNWGNGKAYFFRGDLYTRVNLPSMQPDDGYPKKIKDGWPRLFNGSGVDAAFVKGGKAYFFKGNRLARWDVETDSLDAGYPVVFKYRDFQAVIGGSEPVVPPDENNNIITDNRHRFKIEFDYTFDRQGFFNDPRRRRTLELAARQWGELISSDLPTIRKGTTATVVHSVTRKEYTYTFSKDVDDFMILVVTTENETAKATGGIDWYEIRNGRFIPRLGMYTVNTAASRPWFFDQTPETSYDIPSQTHYDFYSTSLHEIGHAMGFLQFVYKRTGNWQSGDLFVGPNAVRANGGPVYLADNSSHISRKTVTTLARPHLDELVMHAVSPLQGFRFLPSKVDLAMLKDIGYDVNFSALPEYDDVFYGLNPYKEKYNRAYTGSRQPAGLWHFDRADYIYDPWRGYAIKYIPPRKPRNFKKVSGGIQIPKGAYLLADHALPATSGSSKNEVEKYSLVFDLRVPALGPKYSLYNASYGDIMNGGDAYITSDGRIGEYRFSDFRVKAGRWYRLVIVIDTMNNRRSYFIDGRKIHTESAGSNNGLYSTDSSNLPVISFFADAGNDDGDIDISRLALFDYCLSDSQAASLGRAGVDIGFK